MQSVHACHLGISFANGAGFGGVKFVLASDVVNSGRVHYKGIQNEENDASKLFTSMVKWCCLKTGW